MDKHERQRKLDEARENVIYRLAHPYSRVQRLVDIAVCIFEVAIVLGVVLLIGKGFGWW